MGVGKKLVGLGLSSALMISVCTAAGAGASTLGARGTSSATRLTFRANGTPNLSGMTFALGNAAGSAHVGDTNVANIVKFLVKWGASATQINASQNSTELAVAGGKLISTSGPLPTEVDAGLIAFGPNQVHLDDEVLAKRSIKTLSGLKGRTIAYCCQASPDGVLLNAVLKKAHLKMSDIHLVATGASSASLNALVAGQVDAAFTAASGLPTSVTSSFRSLASATSLLPEYADSFMAATPSWLASHQAEAEAIDLAWIASAKRFNSDESGWVSDAAVYTSNADPSSLYKLAWQQLKKLNGWPVAQSSFSASDFDYNLKVAGQQSALTGPGTQSSSHLIDRRPWQEAWAQYSAHQSAY